VCVVIKPPRVSFLMSLLSASYRAAAHPRERYLRCPSG
jgi:hypothetical protein